MSSGINGEIICQVCTRHIVFITQMEIVGIITPKCIGHCCY